MGAVRGIFGGFALVVVAGCSFSGTGLTIEVSSAGTEATTGGTTGGEATTGDTPTTSNGAGSVDPDTTNGPTEPPTSDPETTGTTATVTSGETTVEVTATTGTDTGETTKGETGETGETTKGEGDSSTGECDPLPWYVDADGDGYGSEEGVVMACKMPDGYVEKAGDCDDGDEAVSPAAIEVCDNQDNDCDVLIDEYSAMNTMCGGCKIVPDDADEPTRIYYFCDNMPLKSWDAAKGLCEDRDAVLVADESDEEHTFLTAQITAIDPMSGGWWTGGWASGVLGYKWLNNTPISGNDGRWDFVQLASDPNKCVQLLSSGVNNGNKWTARSCNEARPYICEQVL